MSDRVERGVKSIKDYIALSRVEDGLQDLFLVQNDRSKNNKLNKILIKVKGSCVYLMNIIWYPLPED